MTLPKFSRAVRLGERIKHVRISRAMNQQQFANEMGVSAPSVSDWETGKKRPSRDNLTRLSAVLSFPLENLLKDLPPERPVQVEGTIGVGNDFERLLAGPMQDADAEWRLSVLQVVDSALPFLYWFRDHGLEPTAEDLLSAVRLASEREAKLHAEA